MKPAPLTILLSTPFIVLLAHYAAVFPHEFAHSFMAWALGFKPDPLNIDYGGTTWGNLLLLLHVDENVEYSLTRTPIWDLTRRSRRAAC